MLRITAARDAGVDSRLILEGRIAGAWVGELARACEAARVRGRGLVLDMAGVGFVDPEGVERIRRLVADGVVLRDCSPFVRALLEGACDDRASGR